MYKHIYYLFTFIFFITGCENPPIQQSQSTPENNTKLLNNNNTQYETACGRSTGSIEVSNAKDCKGSPEDCKKALENSEQRTTTIIQALETCIGEGRKVLEADVKKISK